MNRQNLIDKSIIKINAQTRRLTSSLHDISAGKITLDEANTIIKEATIVNEKVNLDLKNLL